MYFPVENPCKYWYVRTRTRMTSTTPNVPKYTCLFQRHSVHKRGNHVSRLLRVGMRVVIDTSGIALNPCDGVADYSLKKIAAGRPLLTINYLLGDEVSPVKTRLQTQGGVHVQRYLTCHMRISYYVLVDWSAEVFIKRLQKGILP